MTITFAQAGQNLTLTSKTPVQYSDKVPVTVTLDSEYSSATEIVLLTQPPCRGHPARTLLTRSGSTATGAISRAMLMHAGTTMFVLAGKTGDMYLPTAACMVDVQRAVDPQAQAYAHDPVSVADVIADMVAEYLQTDDGQNMFYGKLYDIADDKGITVPPLSDSVTSSSTTTAATSAAVKNISDRLVSNIAQPFDAVKSSHQSHLVHFFDGNATVGGITVPQWSLGAVITAGGADAVLIAITTSGEIVSAFRNNGSWIKGSTTNTDSGWIDCYGDYMRVRKRNGIVTVVGCDVYGQYPLTAGTYMSVSTAPIGFRPDRAISFVASEQADSKVIYGVISVDGILKLYSAGGCSGHWTYSVSYPASDVVVD